MVHQLILLLAIASTLLHIVSSIFRCTGPSSVTFNSTNFTITGPCPNDTVIAPVGSTVQYRCEYVDMKSGYDLPYWHIAELSGTPFQQGEGGAHGIAISGSASSSNDITTGYTIIDIPVKEQYLNNTLNIQCGLCSLTVCSNPNRLSENITSTTVILVSFGSPRQLQSTATNDIITLQWQPPSLSSTDLLCCPDCFIYNIQLINDNNQSQIIHFNTTNTTLNITRLNITEGFDTCSNYTWNISASAKQGKYNNTPSEQVQGNDSILLQSVPTITSDVIYSLETNNIGINISMITFTISTLQSLDTLQYEFCSSNYSDCCTNTSIVTVQNDSTVHIHIPAVIADNITDLKCITVFVINECGNDSFLLPTSSCDHKLTSTSDVMLDVMSPSSSPVVAMVTISMLISSVSMVVSDSVSTDIMSTPASPTDNSNSTSHISIYIYIPIIVLIISLIIIILILVAVFVAIFYYRKKRSFALNDKNDESDYTVCRSDTIDNQPNESYIPHAAVSDYLTPMEAITALDSHNETTTVSNSENQYCEPEKLRSMMSSHPPSSTVTRKTTAPDWDNTQLEEVAGYCIPPNQIMNNSKEIVTATQNEDSSIPMYADINEIKAKKSANNVRYANLDLPSPTTETPPPLPPPPIYSEIIQASL